MVVNDPFFWALVSMFALVAGNAIQGSPVVGRSQLFGLVVVLAVTFGRVVLVLPFVEQPRLGGGLALRALGALVILGSLGLMAPLLRIKPLTRPEASEALSTSGVFGVVRHPGYLANTLWGLGWALLFGSTIGALLTPVWGAAFWLHALIEEESLRREYGPSYERYMERVRARIVPGLPL